MQNLKITLIQSNLVWENIESNLDNFDKKLDTIKEPTDLIVLPEMFTTGFSMNAKSLAEDFNGRAYNWLLNKAKEKSADIIGSIIFKQDGRFYNRLLWVKRDRSAEFYDKRHLFRMAGEHNIYSAGNKKLTGKIKDWNICPLVCYDLRFPVWSRFGKSQIDLLIYIANWPERRSSHWRLLLKARAVENQCYVVGVNRVGTDGLGIYYRGDSAVINPLGETLFEKAEDEEIKNVELDREKMLAYRNKFPVWRDADSFKIDN